jgi:hypothetical protein
MNSPISFTRGSSSADLEVPVLMQLSVTECWQSCTHTALFPANTSHLGTLLAVRLVTGHWSQQMAWHDDVDKYELTHAT